METLKLNAETRNTEETAKELRNSKKLVWVVYWKKRETISIKMDYSDFLKTFRKSGTSHIINLNVDKKEIDVIVHDIQKNPISWDFIHIDFFAITKWERLTTHISLSFVWESNAAKAWAIIDERIKEVEVKCLPKDLVDSFEVDLSKLEEAWDVIRISDLGLSSKYEVLSNESDIIVAAIEPAKTDNVIEEVKPEETKVEPKTENKE